MSQFPSAPPPGAYVPPNQTPQSQGFNQQQQPHYGYQQTQPPSPYGAPASGYNPSVSHKSTKAFGQVFNQAVTQGKPMLDKLGKTISSKLGNKQPKQSIPQHLESYQNYQQHQHPGQPQVQQYQQTLPQSYQSQGQQFSPGPQNAYQTPQQSPFVQSAYGTPVLGTSGQSNYFPQQSPPTQSQQVPQYQQSPQAHHQQSNSSNLNANKVEPAHSYGQPPGQPTQGQFVQEQSNGLPPQTPVGQASGQQAGVIGGSQTQLQSTFQQPPPPACSPPPPEQNQQTQHAPFQNASPSSQSPTPFNPTPPLQQYGAAPPVPIHPSQQQAPQYQQLQHQQWTSVQPVSPQAQQAQPPPSVSSPSPQPSEVQKPASPDASFEQQHHSQIDPPQQQLAQPLSPATQQAPSKSSPMEFIAELPADLGSMSIVEGSKTKQTASTPSQIAQYQAYRPASGQNASPGPGYTIPRRALSTSSLPLADPWRFADPVTELPTREFYIIADLIFDNLDRRFEPQSTGLLEASKVLESWKAQQLPEEAARLFTHDSYNAFAKIWSLEGVPHVMVPYQPSLMPTWNFQPQIHSQQLKLQEDPALATAAYPVYIPALNRTGWYKYFFLNMLHQPEDLEKMLSAFCADTYKPSILNQPDVQKRDRNEPAALVSRATAISTGAISRVCQEVVAQMQGTSQRTAFQQGGAPRDASQGVPQGQHNGDLTDPDAALKMHSLQIQQQFKDMMNHTTT